jgi:hypothetical protein
VDLWQTMSEVLVGRRPGRYLRLRYEDFVARPEASVRRIAGLVGEEPAALPFVSPAAARLGVTHSVSGNPNRFEMGAVQLRPDVEWVDRLGRSHRAVVTAVTWPLLLRYRYPLRPGRAALVRSQGQA